VSRPCKHGTSETAACCHSGLAELPIKLHDDVHATKQIMARETWALKHGTRFSQRLKLDERGPENSCSFFYSLFFLVSEPGGGDGRGSKSRDISSGDRHGARDLGREKTKRLGVLSATAFSHLLVFLFLIAGIARTSSPACPYDFLLSQTHTRSTTLSIVVMCWGLAFWFFAWMEENRTHLAKLLQAMFSA